jgi:hypothetical protein
MKKRVYNEKVLKLMQQEVISILKKRNVSLRRVAILLNVSYNNIYSKLKKNDVYYLNLDFLYEIAKRFQPDHPVIDFVKYLENNHNNSKKEDL